MTTPALEIPPGYGFRILRDASRDMDSLLGKLLIFEPPRRDSTYVLPVDVSEGVGLDRSVATVVRVPTLKEPAEEVAQFITDSVPPVRLAPIVDALGRLYSDADGREALMTIETNGPGIATQGELQGHFGYSNFYIWQYLNSGDPRRRFSTRIGWTTSNQSRPLILSTLFDGLTTVDPISGFPPILVNSPFTLKDLRDFISPGPIWQGEAASGCFDDTVLTLAIGYWVARNLFYGEVEPEADRRARQNEERARAEFMAGRQGIKRDWQNCDATAAEVAESRGDFLEELYAQAEEGEVGEGWPV